MESFGKALFYQWPLVHQFGFITANCYSLFEMQDGEYSPCDLLPLGISPLVLQDTMLQFANELGVRHSQEARKEFMLQWQQVRAVALLQSSSKAIVSVETKSIIAPSNATKQRLDKSTEGDILNRFPCAGITCS